MKTDNLIDLLAQDAPAGPRLSQILALACVIGVAASASIMLLTIGVRPGMMDALMTLRVMLKIGVTVLLAVLSCRLVFQIGQPGVELKGRVAALLLPVAVLFAGIVVELVVVPEPQWSTSLTGRFPAFCLVFVPLLSVAPLIAFCWALKQGAPEKPGLAGAAAGLAAGAIGASIYAWHCPDDSPLFIATWYVLAIGLVTIIGYLGGRRLLRW